MDPQRQQRLNQIAAIAFKIEGATGVPARSTIAQWAVESEWGAKPCGHANYFGIKWAPRHTMSCIVTTEEVFTAPQVKEWNQNHPGNQARILATLGNGEYRVGLDDKFADYPDLEASARDYAWLVSHGGPYSGAWAAYHATKDVDAFVRAIAGHYSTSPSYAALVTTIAGESAVVAALELADRAEVA